MYKLIVFDIDGTITRHVSSWQLIHEKLNMWNELACKYQEQFLSGKISYKKFCQLDAACWRGMPEKCISALFEKVEYTKYAKSCIKKLKRDGFKLAAISTGLQYIAEAIEKDLGFDFVLSNRLLSKKGSLTGSVEINIAHGAKGVILKRIFKHFNLKPCETIGIGDSEGDIPLLKESGYSIAFNSSDKTLSSIADYACKTDDFREVYTQIRAISKNRPILRQGKAVHFEIKNTR